MFLLSEVLKYENPDVVLRFKKEKSVSLNDAEEIFLETKRWLWLCGSQEKPVNMIGDAFVIDEMWHAFLLFTKDYADFCTKHFGKFIHHTPKTELKSDPVQLRNDYELIYDQLGPEVLIKWSKTFPEKFIGLIPKE